MKNTLSDRLETASGFDWDGGNKKKNWLKHQVTTKETEEVFFNSPRVVAEDPGHSQAEKRYGCYGRTNMHRRLFVVFTFRGDKIRVISARDQNRKEEEVYEQTAKQAA